jgi:hypothetical protein
MVKESVSIKKKTIVKKSSIKKQEMDNILLENFVSLQKVMTNLAVKFDSLSVQITKLLELFEISAKAFAEKDYSIKDKKEEEKIVQGLNTLLDQNKIIARGIALLHEKDNYSQETQPINNYPPVQDNSRLNVPVYTKPNQEDYPRMSQQQGFSNSKIKSLEG